MTTILQPIKKLQILNNNAIKIIAIVSMFVDHLAKMIIAPFITEKLSQNQHNIASLKAFVQNDLVGFGRMAMPLFCYLIAEGFVHSSNKKKYILTIFGFAILSEYIYDFCFVSNCSLDSFLYMCFSNQNVLFTLGLGLLNLECINQISKKIKNNVLKLSLTITSIALFCFIANILNTSYEAWGILFITSFYLTRFNRALQALSFLIIYILMTQIVPSIFIILTAIVILLYNNQKGCLNLKYFFYWFYPVHLIFLFILSYFIVYS